MRKSLLLMSAAALGLALPAMAQDTSSAKSPPSPNSSNSMPQPSNSLPVGGATATRNSLGDVSTTPTAPMAPPSDATAQGGDQGDMTGMQPMRHPRHRMARHRPMNENAGEITPATGAGPGEPRSRQASPIDPGDTRGDIAPALPMPPVRGNGPEAYLAAADHALSMHQSGEAQEALERAETRLLDRSVPTGEGNMPMQDPRLTQIHDARMALANRNYSAARQNIQQAMNMHGSSDQMSPAGTMPAQPGMAQPGMAQPGTAQPGMAQPGPTQPGPAAQPGMAQ